MLQQRTELEVLLRQSLDDVKAEILRPLGRKFPFLSELAKSMQLLDMFGDFWFQLSEDAGDGRGSGHS